MKYTLTLDQKSVFDNNLEGSIDIYDLSILSVIKHIISMSKVEITKDSDGTFYWVSYTHVCSELPILKLKKDSVYRRIKSYVDLGLLIPHNSNFGGQKTYFKITELFDRLFSDTVGCRPDRRSDVDPKVHNIDEHYTNEHKEIYKEKILFYESELKSNLSEKFIQEYQFFIKMLTGDNELGKQVDHMLKIPQQLSYKQFQKLIESASAKSIKLSRLCKQHDKHP